MSKISKIMNGELVTVNIADPVSRVVDLMENFRIGGLPVVEQEQLVGIITSRDVRRSHPNRLVADAMSRKVVTIRPDCSLWDAKELLEEYGIERLVVAEEERPVGIVTKSRVYAEIGKHMDALTGLNRAQYLQRKASELLCEGKEIVFIFIDMDNFGMIDKRLGHAVGDEILTSVAKLLNSLVEDGTDFLCRYAGDEFAVLTTRPLEEAKQLAWKMISAIEEANWSGGIIVTGSAGIAGGRRKGIRSDINETYTIADLINMASLSSTKAKKEKKRVLVAEQMEIEHRVTPDI